MFRPRQKQARRLSLRFSVKVLLVAFVPLGIFLAIFAMHLKRAEQQRKAVEILRQHPNKLYNDYQAIEFDDGRIEWAPSDEISPKSTLLRRLLGNDFFDDVPLVIFPPAETGWSSRGRLAVLTHNELRMLRYLKGLREVRLPGRLDDAGMADIGYLVSLKRLTLINSKVTDVGIRSLTPLTQLEELCISNTLITDDGLRHLSALSNLEWLGLADTSITDDGLSVVKYFPNLKGISLGNTRVTSSGMGWLVQADQLDTIFLRNTGVTDEGIMVLTKLKRLRRLNIYQTKVSKKGIEAFNRALPNCQVFY